MAFRISELTSAVNSYLNSISSVNNRGASIGSDLKGIFQKYFSKAVSDTKVEMPDIGKQIKENIEAHNFTAAEAAEVSELSKEESTVNTASKASSAANPQNTSVTNSDYATSLANLITVSKASGNLDIAQALDTIMKANQGTTSNADAYKGALSTKALRDLSDSSYFYTNMIQSSLFKPSDDEDSTSGSNNDAFSGTSLNQLNENALVNATLGTTTTTDSSYYQSLIKAYQSMPTESIFGDFLL